MRRSSTRTLIPVVTNDASSGEVLMMGVMSAEALRATIHTGEAHYWSRSRQCLWHKGATSGLVQRIVEMRIDDDQDPVWLRVDLLADPPVGPYAEAVADQQHADHQFGIDRRPTRAAVERREVLPDVVQINKPIDGADQMVLRD